MIVCVQKGAVFAPIWPGLASMAGIPLPCKAHSEFFGCAKRKAPGRIKFSVPRRCENETFVWGDRVIVVEQKILGEGAYGAVHR